MQRITIFHYHLQTGGITKVIAASLRSLLHIAPDDFEIQIVCGRPEGSRDFVDKLREGFPASFPKDRLSCEVFEEIDYQDRMQSPPDPQQLKRKLLANYGGSIWWVHNYHIGKNAPFTLALLEAAEEDPEQKLIFHIHDFPESGRFENQQKNRSLIKRSLYPILDNVAYVVINSRDYKILVAAGIPEQRLFLLNNPIEQEQNGFIDIWRVHDKLNRWAEDGATKWVKNGKLILYPVRTIRRKNVLEAALLVSLLENQANLLVTLPGVSEQERGYSDLVQRAFREGLVPGAWGIGNRLDEFATSFAELTHAADLILSTSIQEGFGYLFIDSLLWEVPLVARDLSVLEALKPLFRSETSYFYSSLNVSLTEQEKIALGDSYSSSMNGLSGLLPEELLNPLRYELEQLLAGDEIDFSFLTPELQYEYLEKLSRSQSLKAELRDRNAELVAYAENLLRGKQVAGKEKVIRDFGPEAHSKKIFEILNAFQQGISENKERSVTDSSIDRRVLQAYSHIDYFRPLYFG